MPEVSVVIPLYNKEPHIERALDSVLEQTCQDFEVIIVNDGSTDKSAAKVLEYEDQRIRLIQQDNMGVSVARNRGIDEAESDLIAFLDADDRYLPHFLETILRLREKYPDSGLFGTAYEVHFPGSVIKRVHREEDGERQLRSYFGSLVEFDAPIFNSSSFASPKDVLLRVGGFPTGVKWNEDGTLWGKIAMQFPVAYSPIVCSEYHKYTINNSAGSNREYQENPFLQYLSTIPKEEIVERSDAESLREYMDLCRIAAISRNINSGHGGRTRGEISMIVSGRFHGKKTRLWLFSFIPQCIIKLIRKNARTLSYMKWKILGS